MKYFKQAVRNLFRLFGLELSRYKPPVAVNSFCTLYPHCRHDVGFTYDVFGHMLYQNVADHVNYSSLKAQTLCDYRAHNSDEIAFIINAIKPGQIVIDIGASIGLYTLLLARLVGSEGKVIAFEPGPVSFSLLKVNTILNGYKNVTPVNKAVTAFSRCEYYFSNQIIESGSTVTTTIPDFGHPRERIPIETVTLDDYFRGTNFRIDYIKMDIEGGEYNALKGMTRLLTSNPEIRLTVEYAPYLPLWKDVNLHEFLDFVRELDFKIYDLKRGYGESVTDEYLIDTYPKREVGKYATLLLQRS